MKKLIGFLKRTGIYDMKPVRWLKNRVIKFMGRSIKKNGMDCLAEIDRGFKAVDCNYWIDFGTLLGFHREGHLLSHDFDIDISIMQDEYTDGLKNCLKKRGFQLQKEYYAFDKLVEQSWRWKGVYVDLFMYQKKEDKIFPYFFYTDKTVQESRVQAGIYRFAGLDARSVFLPPVKPIAKKFGELSLMVPEDTDTHLKTIYGKNYMIPDKDWQSSKSPNIFKVDHMEMYAYRYDIK